MARTFTPLPQGTERHLRDLLKRAVSTWEYRRIQCVLLRVSLQLPAEKIGPMVGLHPSSIWRIWAHYLRRGDAAILGERRGQVRGRAILTREEERALLQPFLTAAERGHLTTIREVYRAHCAHVGRKLDPTVTYRLLDRHGWRKIVPRPHHPKTDRETQENFKVFFPQRDHTGKGRGAPLWAPFPVDVPG